MRQMLNKAGKSWILFVVLLLLTQMAFALPFAITPKAGTSFPTKVPAGGAVTAYYTVQNNDGVTRSNNFVKYLPPNVAQVVSGATFPDTCGFYFTLQPAGSPGSSCTLQLSITGAVNANDPHPHHHLFVCFPGGITCAGTNYPLNVTVGAGLLASITIAPINPTLPQGQSLQFVAIGTFTDGSVQNITNSVSWTSSNTTVATINSTGLATAGFTGGITIITAASGSLSASTSLTVPTKLTSITVEPANALIDQGDTLQYTAIGHFSDGSTRDISASVTWGSSNTSVATISASGLATAVGGGTTNITATSGSITGMTTLTVPSLVSITVQPMNATIDPGATLQYTAIGNFSDGSTQDITASVTWSTVPVSSTVATINASGLATAGFIGGTVQIKATSGSISGTTNLTVPTLQSIKVTPVNAKIAVADKLQYTATGTYSDLSTENITTQVTWTSGNTAIASISASGLATGVGTGSTSITATLGTKSNSTTIYVVNSFAFVVDNIGNKVYSCAINSNKSLGTCTSTGTDCAVPPCYNGPNFIALNPANTFAYTVNNTSSDVTVCATSNTGTLSGCVIYNGLGTFNTPFGIAIDPTGTYAYITNNDFTITSCKISNIDGSLNACANFTPTGTALNQPLGIAINPAGTFAYIANVLGNSVSFCAVNNGTLSGCATTGSNFNNPVGIAIDPAGTFAYVVNNNGSTVTSCAINQNNGTLSGCNTTGSNFHVPLGVAVNPVNLFAYVTNNSASFTNVTYCAISNGTLGSCNLTPTTPGPFSGPYGIAIGYVL